MKISELQQPPEWLKQAKVKHEDVEMIGNTVVWKTGTWEAGIWEGGVWEAGIWEGGVWKAGTVLLIAICKWRIYYNASEGCVTIGCKVKNINEWDEWFKSDETFETERDTEDFKNIEKAYKLAKYAIELNTQNHGT